MTTKPALPPYVLSGAILLALFAAAILFRPLLPIDETRYLTVAWEMRLHQGWLAPLTLNFEPYHHKPPLLFWAINLFWSVFGVSRWAALIPVVLAAFAVTILTGKLARKLFPQDDTADTRLQMILAGSVPFIIYSTLMMFDIMLTAFVLYTLLLLIRYSETGKLRFVAAAGLTLGLGVLTKGPVAYLYVIFPVLFGPVWIPAAMHKRKWYGGSGLSFVLSLVPVALWIVPVLRQADNHFAFWLLWEQTAGRVTGNFSDAHNRPFYFYLPLLPVMMMPWIFFPSFWRAAGKTEIQARGFKFLALWAVPVFVAFCLISGKQPHYLVPLLPAVAILLSRYLKDVRAQTIRRTVLAMVAIAIAGQAAASATLLRSYDLGPIADYVAAHRDRDWAFVRNYHGEIGFLAGLENPVADREKNSIAQWFEQHPGGLAMIRFHKDEEVAGFHKIMEIPYRGKRMGVFAKKVTAVKILSGRSGRLQLGRANYGSH